MKALLKIRNFSGSITFGTCDSGAILSGYSPNGPQNDTDLVVWGARNHVNAIRSNLRCMDGLSPKKDLVKYVSVKKPLENPISDAIITGTFFHFRSI